MIADQVYEKSLHNEVPYAALRAQILRLHNSGHAKPELIESLERLVLRLRSEGRSQDEEIVMDILDALSGWCHPRHHLLPEDGPLPDH